MLLNKEADRTFLLSNPYTVNRNSDVNLIGYLVLLNNKKKRDKNVSQSSLNTVNLLVKIKKIFFSI